MEFYNFAAGPAMLPKEVLWRIKEELNNFRGQNMSILELGHRTPTFERLIMDVQEKLRALMAIPADYKILFCHGGAQGQFAAIPFNLGCTKNKLYYIVNGIWSDRAFAYARKYDNAAILAKISFAKSLGHFDAMQFEDHMWELLTMQSMPELNTRSNIALADELSDHNSGYIYYCPNETIDGVMFKHVPFAKKRTIYKLPPLVADMTSFILTQTIPIKEFGLIFAAAQKNLGIAGVSLVIVHQELLRRQPSEFTPDIWNYSALAQCQSLVNTVPTFAIYVMDLMMDWLSSQGGIAAIEKCNMYKAQWLYTCIDNSNGFYVNHVQPNWRSTTNIPFTIGSSTHEQTLKLETLFLKEAANNGLLSLKGHKLLGGLRASLYNAMPISGVKKLVGFMEDFAFRYKNEL